MRASVLARAPRTRMRVSAGAAVGNTTLLVAVAFLAISVINVINDLEQKSRGGVPLRD